MGYKKVLIGCASVVVIAATSAYGYVFIAGAPQLDGPQVEAIASLPYQLEQFQSQAMGTTRQYGVILSPDYAQHPQQRYPVIFLLHGGHDDATAFDQKYGITSVLHQLYDQKKLPPSIVIMPDGNDNRGSSPIWDPQYFNGPNGNVGTLIGSELVQVVKSRYRTLDDPNLWAMGGVSSGGWGAFNVGLRHLDHFKTLFSHSGYFTDKSGPQNSPETFIPKLPTQTLRGLHVYMDAGENSEDTFFLASSKTFHQTLNQLQVHNVFQSFPGGHGLSGPDVGWNYFHKHLSDSLSYVGDQFKQGLAPHHTTAVK